MDQKQNQILNISDGLEEKVFLESIISNAIQKYDIDRNGILDRIELRHLIDDLRAGLCLPKTDNKIFNRAFRLQDKNKDGNIDRNEIIANMREFIPLLCECGEEMEVFIKKIFNDFDVNGSGYLELNEMKLLQDIQADRMGVKRSDPWQVDYIMSLLDIDNNRKIEYQELLLQYGVINKELAKNVKIVEDKDPADIFADIKEQHDSQPGHLRKDLLGFTEYSLMILRKKRYIEENKEIPQKLLNYDTEKMRAKRICEIKRQFDLYDDNINGRLDKVEARNFFDDMRYSQYQPKSEDELFQRFWTLLDNDKNGKISKNELADNLDLIAPIICECGNILRMCLKKIFVDYNLSSNGKLDQKECKLLLDIHCDKIGIKRPTITQSESLFDEIDQDGSGTIECEELLLQYPMINRELVACNKPVGNRRNSMNAVLNLANLKAGLSTVSNSEFPQQKKGNSSFEMCYHFPSLNDDQVVNKFCQYAINYIRRNKILENQKKRTLMNDAELGIDQINVKVEENCRNLIPVTSILNSRDKTAFTVDNSLAGQNTPYNRSDNHSPLVIKDLYNSPKTNKSAFKNVAESRIEEEGKSSQDSGDSVEEKIRKRGKTVRIGQNQDRKKSFTNTMKIDIAQSPNYPNLTKDLSSAKLKPQENISFGNSNRVKSMKNLDKSQKLKILSKKKFLGKNEKLNNTEESTLPYICNLNDISVVSSVSKTSLGNILPENSTHPVNGSPTKPRIQKKVMGKEAIILSTVRQYLEIDRMQTNDQLEFFKDYDFRELDSLAKGSKDIRDDFSRSIRQIDAFLIGLRKFMKSKARVGANKVINGCQKNLTQANCNEFNNDDIGNLIFFLEKILNIETPSNALNALPKLKTHSQHFESIGNVKPELLNSQRGVGSNLPSHKKQLNFMDRIEKNPIKIMNNEVKNMYQQDTTDRSRQKDK